MNEQTKKPRIYLQILGAFSWVVGMMFLVIIILTLIQNYIVAQHNRILRNLLYEGRFAQDIPTLINTFYSLVGSRSQERLAVYQTTKEQILDTIANLDASIVDEKSKSSYFGIRTIAESIIKDCDEGLQAGFRGDQITAAQKYDSALQKNSFIEQNSAALVLAEMQYAENLANNLTRFSNVGIYFSLLLLVAMIVWIIFFVGDFAKKLSTPLSEIAVSANQIEQENFNISIDPKILQRNDEMGMLGRAFMNMVSRLKSNIMEVRRSNSDLQKAQKDLEAQNQKLGEVNDKLARMNKFMVGREIRMIELKKRIAELEGKPYETDVPEENHV